MTGKIDISSTTETALSAVIFAGLKDFPGIGIENVLPGLIDERKPPVAVRVIIGDPVPLGEGSSICNIGGQVQVLSPMTITTQGMVAYEYHGQLAQAVAEVLDAQDLQGIVQDASEGDLLIYSINVNRGGRSVIEKQFSTTFDLEIQAQEAN